MEITKEVLQASLDLAENEKVYDQLEAIYGAIPSGKCSGCTKCCMESVNTFYVEFLNIYRYLEEKNLLDQWLKKVEDHYFNELVKKEACPFLQEDGLCVIYPVRPLVCRLFGHASQEEHEANYENVLAMNLEARDYFKENYDIELSDEVVAHKIDYCQSFVVEDKIDIGLKNSFIDKLFNLDSIFLFEDLITEDDINIGLTNWFIYLKYSVEDSTNERIRRLKKAKVK